MCRCDQCTPGAPFAQDVTAGGSARREARRPSASTNATVTHHTTPRFGRERTTHPPVLYSVVLGERRNDPYGAIVDVFQEVS